MAAAQLQDKYVLRLPDGMRDRLKVAAADNGRSMNAEIVARLEASLASPSVADQLAAVEATVRTLAAKIEGMPPVTPPRARRAQGTANAEPGHYDRDGYCDNPARGY